MGWRWASLKSDNGGEDCEISALEAEADAPAPRTPPWTTSLLPAPAARDTEAEGAADIEADIEDARETDDAADETTDEADEVTPAADDEAELTTEAAAEVTEAAADAPAPVTEAHWAWAAVAALHESESTP